VITFPPVESGDRMSVSATLYVTYRTCPQQALGRVRGVYPPDSVASFKGSLAHRLFARHLAVGPIPPDAIEQACREEIGAPEGHLNERLAPLGLTRPSRLAPVVREVSDLYARFAQLPIRGFRDAEVSLDVTVAGDVRLRGRVDAVLDDGDGVAIVDWKTGRWLEDAEPQLEFYILVWMIEHEEVPRRAEAVSVLTGERLDVAPDVERARSTARDLAEMIDALRAAIRSGEDLERTAGPHCRWCPLLGECAEGASAVAVLAGPGAGAP
jgi:hypothetical protein